MSWWMIQVSATLQAVATQNYACFGRGGVPRYAAPKTAALSEPVPQPDPATLCVELIVRAPDHTVTEPKIRLANLDITLKLHEQTALNIIWSGYDPAQHLQTIWVWDFFRLLSHVVLRVADVPTLDTDPDPAWKNALGGIQAVSAGDVLTLDVRSACGDIHQFHTLAGPAIRWKPAQA